MADRRVGSISRRVTAGVTLILLISLTVAVLIAGALLRRALTRDVDSTLRQRIEEIKVDGFSDNLDAVFKPTGRDSGQVQVWSASGLLNRTEGLAGVFSFRFFAAPPMNEFAARSMVLPATELTSRGPFRVIAHTFNSSNEGPITVWAVSSIEAATHAERFLRGGLLVALPLLALLSMVVIWRTVDRSLAPVDAMRAEVDRIEASDLSARVSPLATDDEIGRLATTLNRLLDRVEESTVRQQLFAAASSHELRSPLAAIRTELEVALAYPERTDWPAVARDSLIEVDRLEALARDLRVITRARPSGPPSEFDLAALVASEVTRRQPPPHLEYRLELAAAFIEGEGDAVVQIVRNLLDNAERHAASTISIATSSGAAGVVMTVANDGPPLAEADRERVFEPFMRLDEARSLDEGGSGLGLAIARAMAVRHGGTLTADDPGPAGGALFRAWFPPRTH